MAVLCTDKTCLCKRKFKLAAMKKHYAFRQRVAKKFIRNVGAVIGLCVWAEWFIC